MRQPVNRVRNTISSGQNVRQTRSDGMTPLHLATIWDRMDVAQLLLDNGADIHAVDEQGQTPYDVAISQEMKHFLESHGAVEALNSNSNGTNPQLYENWNRYEREHNVNSQTNNYSNTESIYETSMNVNEDPSPYENTETIRSTNRGNNPTRPFNLNANYNIISPPVYNNRGNSSAKDPIAYINNTKRKSFFRRIIGGKPIMSQKDIVNKLTTSLKKCREKDSNLTKKNKQRVRNNNSTFSKTQHKHKKVLNLFMPNYSKEWKSPKSGFKRTKTRNSTKELLDNIPFNMSIHNTVKNKKQSRTKTKVYPRVQSRERQNNLHLIYRSESNANDTRGNPENIPYNPNTNRVIQIQPRHR